MIFDPATFITVESQEGQDLISSAGLKPLFSPGHSPGHVVYYHEEDQVLIAGDLFTATRNGKLRPPMKGYTADMRQALASGERILKDYSQALVSVCHGSEVKDAVRDLRHRMGLKGVCNGKGYKI